MHAREGGAREIHLGQYASSGAAPPTGGLHPRGNERIVPTRGQVVFVAGEAGIGKSRLLLEFRRRLAATGEPTTWLEGRVPVEIAGGPPVELQPCLVMKGLQCVRSDVGNLRRRRLGKLRQRPDPRRPQPRALPAADPTQTELSRSRRGLARCASASVWPHGKRTSPLPGEDSASTALPGSRGMSRLMAAILTSIRDREGHGPGPALSTAERICLLRAPPG